MGNASNGNCYPAPEVVESFIDVFSETGNRSADLINKDSACAKTKKIAFVGKEKWIKTAFCRFLPQSRNMHKKSTADTERRG